MTKKINSAWAKDFQKSTTKRLSKRDEELLIRFKRATTALGYGGKSQHVVKLNSLLLRQYYVFRHFYRMGRDKSIRLTVRYFAVKLDIVEDSKIEKAIKRAMTYVQPKVA